MNSRLAIATLLLSLGELSPDLAGSSPQEPVDVESEEELISAPVFVPVISSNPKLATSGGLMIGYRYQFDRDSPASMFGAMGSYTTSGSSFYGVFASAYWDADRNRLRLALFDGEIKNDYEDFLGSGLPAQTTDDMRFYGGRYLRQVSGPWYAGMQALSSNYIISGDDPFSQQILNLTGLTGVDSVGLGGSAVYDTKDNQNSPREGAAFQVSNLAYREAFGGETDFDVIQTDAQLFLPHGADSTLALQAKARFTFDSPPGGFSTVNLRGYVQGQYLAENMVLVEADERYMLSEKWGASAFAGLAFLYGDGEQADFNDNLYPMIGLGLFREISEDHMVVRADIALGVEGNAGFYLTFNQPF